MKCKSVTWTQGGKRDGCKDEQNDGSRDDGWDAHFDRLWMRWGSEENWAERSKPFPQLHWTNWLNNPACCLAAKPRNSSRDYRH